VPYLIDSDKIISIALIATDSLLHLLILLYFCAAENQSVWQPVFWHWLSGQYTICFQLLKPSVAVLIFVLLFLFMCFGFKNHAKNLKCDNFVFDVLGVPFARLPNMHGNICAKIIYDLRALCLHNFNFMFAFKALVKCLLETAAALKHYESPKISMLKKNISDGPSRSSEHEKIIIIMTFLYRIKFHATLLCSTRNNVNYMLEAKVIPCLMTSQETSCSVQLRSDIWVLNKRPLHTPWNRGV
ncbi:hypothetical protein ACJX0J_027154, partial [Zea mays]